MTQTVDAPLVGQLGPLPGEIENLLAGGRGQGLILVAPEEDPLFGMEHAVVVAQLFQQPRREQGVAVLAFMESFP